MSMRKALRIVMICCGLSGVVFSAESENIFGIKLPQSLDELDAVAYEDQEGRFTFRKWYSAYFFQEVQHYDDPRLGYSMWYAAPGDSDITIYVYDLGLNNIPDGIDLKPVADELAQASRSIGGSGQYSNVEQHDAPSMLSPHFAQVFHKITIVSGQLLKSYTLLRGQNGRFIKVRITGSSEGLELRSAEFLEYLAVDLGIAGADIATGP